MRRALILLLLTMAARTGQAQRSCCCGDLVLRIDLGDAPEAYASYRVLQVAGTPYRDRWVPSSTDTLYDHIGTAHAPYAGQLDPKGLLLRERVGCGFADTVTWVITDPRDRTMQVTFLRALAPDVDLVFTPLPFTPGHYVVDAHDSQSFRLYPSGTSPYPDLKPFEADR